MDDDIDALVDIFGERQERLHFRRLTDIERIPLGRAASLADLVYQALQAVLTTRTQHHVVALLRQLARGGRSAAPAGAGDQDDFTL